MDNEVMTNIVRDWTFLENSPISKKVHALTLKICNNAESEDAALVDLSKVIKEHFEDHNPCFDDVYEKLIAHVLENVDWNSVAEDWIKFYKDFN